MKGVASVTEPKEWDLLLSSLLNSKAHGALKLDKLLARSDSGATPSCEDDTLSHSSSIPADVPTADRRLHEEPLSAASTPPEQATSETTNPVS